MFETFPYQFGPYRIMEKIGQGGMAEIFRAEHRGMEDFIKEVAIKRILASLASNEDFVTQFLDEARIAGSLSHPNIVQIFNVGQVEDAYYIAMEYVNGRHLGQVIRSSIEKKRSFSIEVAASIAKGVAQALSFAHSAFDTQGNPLNVIHRDISPQNILVDFHGSVKLTDFGIAKAANKLFQTTAGVIKGKFSYLAPEQLVGKPASPSSDLFSLGIVFWEMLSGRRLFQGESDIKTIQLVQACQIPPITKFRPDVPLELEEILKNLLTPTSQYRYQEAAMLIQDLSFFLNNNGYSEGPAQISNFMGMLYTNNLPSTESAPTKMSMPAMSMDALEEIPDSSASQSTLVGIEEFVDATTPIATEAELTNPNRSLWESPPVKNSLPNPSDFEDVRTAAVDMSPLLAASAFDDDILHSKPISSSNPKLLEKLGNEIDNGSFEETLTSEEQEKKKEVGEKTYPVAEDPEKREEILDVSSSSLRKNVEFSEHKKSHKFSSTPPSSNKAFVLIMSILCLMLVGMGSLYLSILERKRQTASKVVSLPKHNLVMLRVTVIPPETKVTLNGYIMKGKKGARAETGLSGGLRYRIRATLKGYKSYNQAILLAKPTESLRIELKKLKP